MVDPLRQPLLRREVVIPVAPPRRLSLILGAAALLFLTSVTTDAMVWRTRSNEASRLAGEESERALRMELELLRLDAERALRDLPVLPETTASGEIILIAGEAP